MKFNIMLLVLAIALCSFIYFTSASAEKDGETLVSISGMQAPVEIFVEPEIGETLDITGGASGIRVIRDLGSSSGLENIKFRDDGTRLVFRKDENEKKALIGGRNPGNSGVYILYEGNVYLVDIRLLQLMESENREGR